MDDYDLELDEMELVAAAAGYYHYCNTEKPVPRNPTHGKSEFMDEILNAEEDRCREMFRMDKHVFRKLCDMLRRRDLLRDTHGVKIEEQVGIFLNIIGHNERNRVIQERFQHSGETISRYFNNALKAIKSLSREFLQPPEPTTPTEILGSTRFYPYFKDCIGVIDGMHIPAHVIAKDQPRFRNRRGVLTQNVLAACTLDLQFIFVYPGWEGSAEDSRVLRAVLNDPDQNFPQITEGKYYLVDGGYTNMKGFVAPYQGYRYHIHELRGANQQPKNAQELFNHRHASLRYAIQQCTELLQTRFPVLKLAPPYAFHIQRDLIIAACVLHNFIRREERNDWLFVNSQIKAAAEVSEPDDQPEASSTSMAEEQAAFLVRHKIAASMWNSFINEWDAW
ncbi:putative nuclease HARBI1 [Papaver somniferum]|nr:putative nuclease HARBI1 [Papaver somniferum]XP_026388391.1 putative nuclease HARBI1 [Papaver somniferum]